MYWTILVLPSNYGDGLCYTEANPPCHIEEQEEVGNNGNR
jgi:hypothetical protein